MNRLQKVIAVTALVQCAAAMFGSAAVAWDEVRHRHQERKEWSLLERDQRRFARDETLLRKSVRRYAGKAQIGELQERVRRDFLEVVDDRGRPENGPAGDSSTLAKHHGKRTLS